jgi:Chaperone of endosialidase
MAATGFTPVSLYYSATASNVPLAANLVAGELAMNTADGKLFFKDSSGVVQTMASKATGSIGGSTTQVQFNNAGVLGGSASLTWSGTVLTSSGFAGPLNGTVGATTANTGAFTTLTAATSITNSSLTTGRIVYTTTGGLETSSANLLYSGTDLTVYGLTVGRGAGAVATNTAVGATALGVNTSGTNNTAVGYQAGYSNITGTYSTYLGHQSGYSITGTNNTFGGAFSGANLTTGTYNTGWGHGTINNSTASTGSGSYNSALGYEALNYLSTGSNNVAVGYQALKVNTTASNNTAVGYQAGYTNSTASFNTFIGQQAGYSATGAQNTFVGVQSGYYVTGNKNSILGGYNGNQGGLDIRTASNYIVLADGDGNPRQIIDSSGNALFGTTSSTPIGSGVQGVAILNAGRIDINKTSDAGLYIGRQTTTGALVNFYYGGAGPKGSISTDGTNVAYNTSSDYRLKENIAPMTGALAKVAALKPCTYKWKVDGSDGEGFIAHELAEIVPQCVSGEKDAVDEEGNPKYQGIDTSFLVATLTAAIQELKAEFDAYKASHP